MQIPEKLISSLKDVVLTHLTANGFKIPEQMCLQIDLSFIPKSPLEIRLAPLSADSAILSGDALVSFRKYWEAKGKKFIKVENAVFNHAYFVKISDFVTRNGSDYHWLRYRHVGKKTLTVIDDWLASLGLKRGMQIDK